MTEPCSPTPAATALPAPHTANTVITVELIRLAVEGSRQSPRRRMILPLHKGPEAPLHRMLNALQPSSYIRPHRHLHPPKAETAIVLQGAVACILFDFSGRVATIHILTAGSAEIGIDSEPGVFHTFLALARDSVLFEAKPGPYQAALDKDFAPWAPEEGTAEAGPYLAGLYELLQNRTII